MKLSFDATLCTTDDWAGVVPEPRCPEPVVQSANIATRLSPVGSRLLHSLATRSQALPGNALFRSSASTRATGSGACGKFQPKRSLGRRKGADCRFRMWARRCSTELKQWWMKLRFNVTL